MTASIDFRNVRSRSAQDTAQLMTVLEGFCPEHEQDMQLVKVAGTKQFHREHQFDGDFETCTWDGASIEGEVTFYCPGCDCTWTAFRGQYDWS